MAVDVRIVESAPYNGGCFLVVESLGVGIAAGYFLWHRYHPVAGILGGIACTVACVQLLRAPGVFYIGLVVSVLLWGGLGFKLAAWIWPTDHVWQSFFAMLGAAIAFFDRWQLKD